MPVTTLMPAPKQQYFDAAGLPLVGGKIYTYAAGTRTPKKTYCDAAGTIDQENPIPLNLRGEPASPIYWSGSYRVEVVDELSNVVYTVNDYNTDPAGVWDIMKTLITSAGSSLVGFLQTGVGAIKRSVQDKLREEVSVLDFMSQEQRLATQIDSPGVDHTDAFEKARNAADVVTMPPGFFNVSSLTLNKNNFTLKGAGYNRSIIRATSEAKAAIEVAGEANVTGLILKNFKVQGSAAGVGGIKLGSEDFYCAVPVIENVHVWDYSRSLPLAGYGIQLYKVQNASIHNCWMYRNRYGLEHPNAGYATATKISGKSGYIGEGFIGVYIDGFYDDLYIDDVVIEGNDSAGVCVTPNAVKADRGSNIYINGAYFEKNAADGAGAIVVAGGPGGYQNHVLVMERCYFAMNTAPYVKLDRVIATIRNCKLTPAQVQTTVNTNVRFDSMRYPTGSNYLTEYRAMLGNIMVTDTVDPAYATDLNQLNMVNALTFPEVKRPVSDRHSLDCYEEGINGEWVPVPTGFGGTIIAIVGRYIKVGRLVHFQVTVEATGLVSTWTVSIISLPYLADTGFVSCAPIINADDGTSPGTGFVDATVDSILTSTWAATTGVFVISGTYIAAE